MPYTKTTWQNNPSTATPLSAANLNNLETQYDQAVADCVNVAGDTMTGRLTVQYADAFKPVYIRNTSSSAGGMLDLSHDTVSTAGVVSFTRHGTAANQKLWEIYHHDRTWAIRAVNDAYTQAEQALTIIRTAGSHNIESVDITADTVTLTTANLYFTGAVWANGGHLRITGAQPAISLWGSSAAADNRFWQFHVANNGVAGIRALNDVGAAGGNDIVFNRTGNSISSTQFRSAGVAFHTIDHLTSAITSTGAVTTGTPLKLSAVSPIFRMRDTSGGAESKVWDLLATSGVLRIRAQNDAETGPAGGNYIDHVRSGANISTVSYYNTSALFTKINMESKQIQFVRKQLIENRPQLADNTDPTTGIHFDEFGAIYFLQGGSISAVVSSGGLLAAPNKFGVPVEAHASPGTTSKRFPIYDTSGTLQGYVRVYTA
jgi:hypothetical protein